MSADPEGMMFNCPEHRFVVSARDDGWMSSRGTPGHRGAGCEACDAVVAEAMDFALKRSQAR